MELELTRVDYSIVGITSNNCLKLLPSNIPKQQQKVVIADNDGIVQMFSTRKDDIQIHFKTLPGKAVSSVRLGGALGTIADKIFVGTSNEVRGYTKKGKLFLTFDPGMTEEINTMYVLGSDLFLCGKHIYNHYKDCKGVGSYLCGDKIVDVLAFYSKKSRRLLSLIACEGRMIRALEHARVTSSMELDQSPTVLHIFDDEDINLILFGTINGCVGILDIEGTQGFDRWLINDEKNTSGISCMESYDLNGDGHKNLILGRQDGNIEVYNINLQDNLDGATMIYSNNFNEYITGIQCGVIGCESYDEILVSTYTGRVFGLTTQVVSETNFNGVTGMTIASANNSQKIHKLKQELEDLQSKVLKEREKYQSLTQSFFDELSAIPLLSVKDSFNLNKDSSTYSLIIEVPTAIDNILLQSNVPIEILDVDKNSAVVSYSESEKQNDNYMLATYRCQINTNRLEIKLKTTEGQKGNLQVYVTPLVQPKCSRVLQYDIKALSLHYKIHSFDENRAYNNLSIKGPFSVAEIHSWISQCLPEVIEKVQNLDKTVMCFQSSLVGSLLQCTYQKGEATFLSDNVSTISVLKECLTVEATKKKCRIDINIAINDESINSILKLLEVRLINCQELEKKMSLIKSLNELGVTEEEAVKYLTYNYRKLLEDEKELKREYQALPGSLKILYATVTNLYVDYNKLKGKNMKTSTSKILEVLENYSYSSLLAIFRPDAV